MPRPRPSVLPGIDVLIERGQDELRGRALGVLAGSGAITADLLPTIAALQECRLHIVALFGPEHGLRGAAAAGEPVDSGRDRATRLPVYSLYGERQEPTEAMLEGIEALLIDLQDVGMRYYTYASTVRAVLHAAARRGLPVVLLDRPNPLNGLALEGPVAEPGFLSFVAASRVPARHGLTLGELARWMNEHEGIGAPLTVIPMQGWQRAHWFADTGLAWVPPSPNIPTAETCLAYAASCLIEGTSVSEGRGTTQPFQVLGAPWVDGEALARHLNALELPGVRFRPTWFCPTASKHAGRPCGGVQLHAEDRGVFAGVRTGLHLLATLRRDYPEQMAWTTDRSGTYHVDLLLGSDRPRLAIERGDDVDELVASWQPAIARFAEERRNYLLYDVPSARQAGARSVLPQTEEPNARTAAIDTMRPLDILRLINEQDAGVPAAVARELPRIAAAVEQVIGAFRRGGRLIYVGAGSSGRLGVLDAAEIPPTYGTDPAQVVALLAGGAAAMARSVESAEDDEERGGQDIDALAVTERDVLVGIAASGSTPYVVGALRRGRARGAYAVALVSNAEGLVAQAADLVIAPQTGPEVITGSTRMKAGTAQKLILNMLSTTAMICTGHTYGNLMVDMRATNDKLRERMRRIVAMATDTGQEVAAEALAAASDEMKTAIVMLLAGVCAEEASRRLERASGVVRDAVRAGLVDRRA